MLVSREIRLRYNSAIFTRIFNLSQYAAIFAILSLILSLVLKDLSIGLEWAAICCMWFGALHLWGMPWQSWMKFSIPISLTLITLLGALGGRYIGAILVILFCAGSVFYSYTKNKHKLKNIPMASAAALLIVLLVDMVVPSFAWRAWEVLIVVYTITVRLIAYLHNIHHVSITDKLTGLYNRATFIEYADSFISSGEKVGIMFVDLDNFGDKNNTEGHAAGDRILIESARILQEVVAGNGVASRYGGEEMVALLIEKDIYKAAEEFRSRLPETTGITASVGVVYHVEGVNAQHLIDLADDAMYQAKRSGKNKVVIYN
ncbi:GGDEF domain-containing protein [Paenibacillus sp. FSL H7-0326]